MQTRSTPGFRTELIGKNVHSYILERVLDNHGLNHWNNIMTSFIYLNNGYLAKKNLPK